MQTPPPFEFQRVTDLVQMRRFVNPSIAKKYDFELPEYRGIDQVVEVGSGAQKL